MSFTVHFFGKIADLTGKTSVQISEQQELSEVIGNLKKSYPALEKQTYVVTVNKQVQRENRILQNGDVIGLLPPFSGG